MASFAYVIADWGFICLLPASIAANFAISKTDGILLAASFRYFSIGNASSFLLVSGNLTAFDFVLLIPK